jgi:uncharacterized protein (DUF433 family)
MTMATDALLLRTDESGAIRIGRTRILLELIIRAYKAGKTPEQISESYPSLDLSDIYTIIGHYLKHTDEVETYLAMREQQAKEVRRKIDELQGDYQEKTRRRLKPHLYNQPENVQ